MFFTTDEKRHVYEALTRHNYFPNQKEGTGELPPCFSSVSFTPEIAELLAEIKEPKDSERRALGYDQVSYSVTRHNNVPRTLCLIHPKAYSNLAVTIYENWEEIRKISENKHSLIKPYLHADGRIIVMNYEDLTEKVQRNQIDGFGKRFRVNADIASCFHSIYTHSIPWAVLGFDKAKNKLANNEGDKHWSELLDTFQRKSKRKETQGIAIGPGTSSVIVELVLGAVDAHLSEKAFVFRRYIDDYICFCETYEKAQEFIRVLGKELSVFKLNINLHKTNIAELPEPASSEWVSELMGALPTGHHDGELTSRKFTLTEIIHYLDTAVRLNKASPDGSVIKYAISSLLRYVEEHHINAVLGYVMNLAWHYPVLIPFLNSLMDKEGVEPSDYQSQLNAIVIENAKNGRSEGMAWPLFLMKKHGLKVGENAFLETLNSKDCIAILCLYALNAQNDLIVGFAEELKSKSLYEKDQYWLLLYQLYKDGHIADPYEDGVFDALKENDVCFMPEENHYSLAQRYCDHINNPFIEEKEKVLSFADWKVTLT